jgi:hypothetical protein
MIFDFEFGIKIGDEGGMKGTSSTWTLTLFLGYHLDLAYKKPAKNPRTNS